MNIHTANTYMNGRDFVLTTSLPILSAPRLAPMTSSISLQMPPTPAVSQTQSREIKSNDACHLEDEEEEDGEREDSVDIIALKNAYSISTSRD